MMLETDVFQVVPDITVLACAGRFTMGTRLSETEALSDGLVQEGIRKFVLDLTHAETVDSAGLGVIMHISSTLEQAGGRFRICGANERILHLLSVTHTDTLLAHDADLETSVQKLGADSEKATAAG
jgi:anti-anti-sigma factor